MDVKAGVRERRHNRIRAIQDRAGSGYVPGQDVRGFGHSPSHQHELPAAGHEPVREELFVEPYHDPEFAWRDKERQLLSQWRNDDSGSGGWKTAPTRRQLWNKLIICVMIYVLVIGLFQLQNGWASGAKRFVRAALTEDMQMEAVAAWYRQTFSGAPSFIPAFLTRQKQNADKVIASASKSFHTPAKGTIVTAYSGGHPYVELKTAADSPVVSMDAGLILSAGVQEGIGYSITIQHAGGYQSTYSGLRPGKWEKNDWVNAGDAIGTVAPGEGSGNGILKFGVLKDRVYINPADVVSLD